jgi:hypothetical protein
MQPCVTFVIVKPLCVIDLCQLAVGSSCQYADFKTAFML